MLSIFIHKKEERGKGKKRKKEQSKAKISLSSITSLLQNAASYPLPLSYFCSPFHFHNILLVIPLFKLKRICNAPLFI